MVRKKSAKKVQDAAEKVDEPTVTVEAVESAKPATEPQVTPKLQSDAEALQELQQLLDVRPRVPAAVASIKDGADFVTEYERWNRKADRISPR